MNIHPAKLGALWAFLAVSLGAFGSHYLSDQLSPERLETFETAVRYHMFHALALLAIGALPKPVHKASFALFFGSVIFSTSLYLLIASEQRWLGAITPLGGLLMLFGWGQVFFSVSSQKAS